MCSVRPETPAERDRCQVAEARRDEGVRPAAHRTGLVVHRHRPLPAITVMPTSRHRRDGSPGCLKGLLTAGVALARWVLAWARRTAAHLCHRLDAMCTSCWTSDAVA